MHYTPPTPQDLQALKNELGMTGQQMAELAGVAGGQQWRKYTGGESPRDMGLHILFFMASRLVLSDSELERVHAKMQEIGAKVEVISKPTAI